MIYNLSDDGYDIPNEISESEKEKIKSLSLKMAKSSAEFRSKQALAFLEHR